MSVVETERSDPVMEPLLSARAVGEIPGVSAKAVLALASYGELASIRLRGAVRFEPRAVREFVAARRRRA